MSPLAREWGDRVFSLVYLAWGFFSWSPQMKGAGSATAFFLMRTLGRWGLGYPTDRDRFEHYFYVTGRGRVTRRPRHRRIK